jgi:hypothetical protein
VRKSNLPNLPAANAFQVAEHRYRWDIADTTFPLTWSDVKASAPYKVGEVIYVVHGDGYARAYVHAVTCAKDGLDFWRESYIVRRETATGAFSKRAYMVHPGQVQRGYQRRGWAPEMPKEE